MSGCSPKDRWSVERMELLRTLWNETTKSAAEIAVEFGVSRCAVLGKAHRMGLKDRAPTPMHFREDYIRRVAASKEAKLAAKAIKDAAKEAKAAAVPKKAKTEKPFVVKPGTSKTSPEYRRQFCGAGQMTKSQMMAFLSQAVANTAAMPIGEAS